MYTLATYITSTTCGGNIACLGQNSTSLCPLWTAAWWRMNDWYLICVRLYGWLIMSYDRCVMYVAQCGNKWESQDFTIEHHCTNSWAQTTKTSRIVDMRCAYQQQHSWFWLNSALLCVISGWTDQRSLAYSIHHDRCIFVIVPSQGKSQPAF